MTGLNGIEGGTHVHGPQAQLIGSGRGGLPGEHGPLLLLVTAGMHGQHHGVAMACQMAGPALKTGGGIPQAMGNHHQAAIGTAGRLNHHQGERLGPMGHRQAQLAANHGQGTRIGQARIGGHRGSRFQELLGDQTLLGIALQRLHHLGQIHPHRGARQGLQQRQQGDRPASGGLIHGFGQRLGAQLFGLEPFQFTELGQHQHHLLQQGRSGVLVEGPFADR